tara:strand:+ start:208 stop:696 length:489 start_codon:yes stop_codon:yes gene_type:complete
MTDITDICFLRPGTAAAGATGAAIDLVTTQTWTGDQDFTGELLYKGEEVATDAPPIETVNFTDDQSVTHTLKYRGEDVSSTQEALVVNFQLEIGGLKTYGSVLATHDGSGWHGHPVLYGVQHEHMGYTFSTVNGKVALTLAGGGSGAAATFKYAITKPFGTL